MKKSIYTIIEKIDKDNYIFYNTRTSFIAIYNKKEYKNYLDGNYSKFDKFVVQNDIDEFEDIKNTRNKYISKKKDYIRFTILPTSKCNARCKFCYENGQRRLDMSSQTVKDTIKFIKKMAKGYKKLRIYWFGGEPLCNLDAVYEITKELTAFCDKNDISYKASIATNLSLLTEDNYNDMIDFLRIDKIEFAFDGVGEEHNKIKNYLDKDLNAFNHNMSMLPKLLEKGVTIQLRLNCDMSNFKELEDLLDELMQKYKKYDNFIPYFAMIFKTKYYDGNGKLIDAENLANYKLKIIEIMNKYSDLGMEAFPLGRSINNCYGSNPNSIVIAPDGTLSKCQGAVMEPSQYIGTVSEGIKENDIYNKWINDFLPKECSSCELYPICLGGCTNSYLLNKVKPCIKEKYYMSELLNFVGQYMIKQNIKEYQYSTEQKSNV